METSKCEVLIGLGIIIDIYNNLYHFLLNTFLRAIFKYIEKNLGITIFVQVPKRALRKIKKKVRK